MDPEKEIASLKRVNVELGKTLDYKKKIIETYAKSGGNIKVLKDELVALEKLKDSQDKYFKEQEKGKKASRKDLENLKKEMEAADKQLVVAAENARKFSEAFSTKELKLMFAAIGDGLDGMEDGFDKTAEQIKGTMGAMFLQLELDTKKSMDNLFKGKEMELKFHLSTGDLKEAKKAILDLNDLQIHKEAVVKNVSKIESADHPVFGKGTVGKLATGIQSGKENLHNPKELKATAGALRELGKAGGVAGNAMKTLAFGLEILGKVGGPIMMIATAIIAVAKVVNNFDKMIKELNQNAASMAGSLTGMGDPGAFLKSFNDSLFDVQKNIKLGLDSKDITNYFKALDGAGLSLQGVTKHMGSFTDATELGRRMSLEMGTTMEDAGSAITDQMLEMKSSVDDVASSYMQLAKDAGIAGISTQKFYNSVWSSVSALGFYGKYLDNASSALSKLMDTKVVPFKDAEAAATAMLGAMKNLDVGQAVGLLTDSVVGPEIVEDARKKMQDMSAEIAEKQKKRDDKGTSKEDVARLTDEISETMGRITQIMPLTDMSSAKSLNKEDLARSMGALSEKGSKYLLDYIKHLSGKSIVSAEGSMVFDSMAKSLFGIDKNTIDIYRAQAQAASGSFKQGVELINALSDSDKEKLMSNAAGLLDAAKKNDRAAATELFKASGMSVGDAADAAKDIMNNPALQELLGSVADGKESMDKALKDIAENQVGAETRAGEMAVGSVLDKNQAEAAKDPEALARQDKMIKKLTPLEKILGITKESSMYALASSDWQQAIAEATITTATKASGILSWLIHKISPEDMEAARKKGEEEFSGQTEDIKGLDKQKRDLAKFYKLFKDSEDPEKKKTIDPKLLALAKKQATDLGLGTTSDSVMKKRESLEEAIRAKKKRKEEIIVELKGKGISTEGMEPDPPPAVDKKEPVTSVGDKEKPVTSVGDKKEPDKKDKSNKIDYAQKGEQFESTTGIPRAPLSAPEMDAGVEDNTVDQPLPIFVPEQYKDTPEIVPAGAGLSANKMYDTNVMAKPYANSNTEKPNATTINNITVQGNLLVHDQKELANMAVAINKQNPGNRSGR